MEEITEPSGEDQGGYAGIFSFTQILTLILNCLVGNLRNSCGRELNTLTAFIAKSSSLRFDLNLFGSRQPLDVLDGGSGLRELLSHWGLPLSSVLFTTMSLAAAELVDRQHICLSQQCSGGCVEVVVSSHNPHELVLASLEDVHLPFCGANMVPLPLYIFLREPQPSY